MNRPYRWVALAVFSLGAALSQLLWLNFAPLITLIEKKYGVSEDTASLLILVFPLIYVFLSFPVGRLVDRKGYRYCTLLGTALMAAFACLRIFDSNFWILLAAQVGIAVAQPFILNAITKLVLDWFDKEQGAIATGLGTVGMFLGMALGLAATPYLVDGMGFRSAMIFFAVVSAAIFAVTYLFLKTNPSSLDEGEPTMAIDSGDLKHMLTDRQLVLLFALSFLGLGFFNGLTTWIELILKPYGINSEQAGVAGGMLILGGIAGAAIVPGISDHFRRRKPFLVASIIVALATVLPLCGTGNYRVLLILAAAQGFFFLPAFSLLLEMASEWVGVKKAGTATGILMLTGNAGGVIVIVVMGAIKGTDFRPGVYLLFACLAGAAIISFFLQDSHRNRVEASR